MYTPAFLLVWNFTQVIFFSAIEIETYKLYTFVDDAPRVVVFQWRKGAATELN